MNEPPAWVIDTSTYTHLWRAGHPYILEMLAPGAVLLVPSDVDLEIEEGRETYSNIGKVDDTSWAQRIFLTEDEVWTQAQVKAALGGDARQHLGECAVIACAKHRNLVALIDDREAIAQADLRGVASHDTLWLVIEAYKELFGRDRPRTAAVLDDLLSTDMKLPIDSGESLLSWAYEMGLLP